VARRNFPVIENYTQCAVVKFRQPTQKAVVDVSVEATRNSGIQMLLAGNGVAFI
jgi:hypothetical protein